MNYNETNNFFEINMIKDFNSKKMKSITKQEAIFIDRVIHSQTAFGLDVMCGYGRIANELFELGYTNIEGVDIGNFDFINEKKTFHFHNQDVYLWSPDKKYDFCYSLYNSYTSQKQFKNTIDKCCSLVNEKGVVIIDVFNKEWRDSINADSYRMIHNDNLITVELTRHYDGNVETSIYKVFDKINGKIKEFSLSQCFLSCRELSCMIPEGFSYYVTDSSIEKTRDDNQKNILILKKGGKK